MWYGSLLMIQKGDISPCSSWLISMLVCFGTGLVSCMGYRADGRVIAVGTFSKQIGLYNNDDSEGSIFVHG